MFLRFILIGLFLGWGFSVNAEEGDPQYSYKDSLVFVGELAKTTLVPDRSPPAHWESCTNEGVEEECLVFSRKGCGWETIEFCEIDPFCRKVLRHNYPGVPIHHNVRNFDGTRYRDSVDIITGGFPCQDISVAGKQAGIDGERSGLWSELARVLGEVRPRFAVVENVPMLLSGERGQFADVIKNEAVIIALQVFAQHIAHR